MNQLALAYGIAGISAAIAIATVVGTYGGPDLATAPAVQADRGAEQLAERRRERPRRAQAAEAATPAPAVEPPATVQYVDEQGNPLPPPSARGASRRGEEEGEEEEEEENERRERRHEREEGDDD